MSLRGKTPHVCTDFRQNDLRAALSDFGHPAEFQDPRLGLFHVGFRHPIQLMDTPIQVANMVKNLGQQFPLQWSDHAMTGTP